MPTESRVTVSTSSSVQPSETSRPPLRLSERTEPSPVWAETWSQRAIHARFRPMRALVLSAFAVSGDLRLQKRLTRLNGCCCAPMYVLRSNGQVGIVPGFCRDRMCPLCQHHRGREMGARVITATASMNAPRFLTLTLKHTDVPLSDTLDRLYRAFRELRKSHAWKQHVRGGVATIEVVRSSADGLWHAHIHAIIDGTYWAHASIKDEWQRVTGDSSIVHIEACHDRSRAAKYISTYIAKPADLHTWDVSCVAEYALALTGRRLLMTFGSCFRVKGSIDDCETKPWLASPLASSAAVLRAAERGCRYGSLALNLLRRVGGLIGKGVGYRPEPGSERKQPLAPSDWHELTVALRRVSGDETAWLPRIEPERRFAGQSHAGKRRPFVTMRLFIGDDVGTVDRREH